MSESVNIEKIGLTKDELLRINLTLFREQTKLTLCLESAKKEDVESDWGTELKEQLEQIIGIQKKIHTILGCLLVVDLQPNTNKQLKKLTEN